ncbi:hypothetical protein TBS_31280 [Thermobispora bispora]|jgi:hypothetical protein|uniref:Uncharacterized protein n=1 Tax=Thermobispora bispora (strain ATCC 19993 / DSM 43833 / CBS 139.67 / JCM 10125 / KCTC 9307 / NBRC 14880 / R51) TaxID=469371 RepID=D6Y840_THEBD|nr:hypothetical protein [Thermobispora bispora]ADG89776.1 hypothetical protein Tbis_3081 [Thermobispora bispora DSM 43833]MBX6169189.1 hypothetical protein [Thermobispora bispora]MDI9581540.1 hypothetical protein [Thermobispora sp.]QSI49365.1 hypothetical protein CYL17_17130 [Thermobispora bispora]
MNGAVLLMILFGAGVLLGLSILLLTVVVRATDRGEMFRWWIVRDKVRAKRKEEEEEKVAGRR